MSYTKQWLFTKSEGKDTYKSTALTAKINALKTSGDILSLSSEVLSSTQSKITIVFRDEAAFNSYREWVIANENSSILSYNSTNNISVQSL